MRIGCRAAPLIEVLQHVFHLLVYAVKIGVFIEHSVHAAFAAGAVVAGDEENQRIVEFTHILNPLHEPPDLVVGVCEVGGEHGCLVREQFLLVGRKLVPVLDGLRLGCEFRAFRNNAQFDLPGEGFFANRIPALVEFAFPLFNPFFRNVVRRVGCARRKIDEERSVGRHGLLELDPVDRLIRHVGQQVVVRIVRKFHNGGSVMQIRRPLVGLSA